MGIASIIGDIAKDAGRDAGRDAVKDAGRDAARDAARDAGRDAGRDAVRGAVNDTIKDTTKDTTRNTKLIKAGIGLAAVAGVSGFAIQAALDADKINAKEYIISKITDKSTLRNNDDPISITFSPGENINKNDKITITNSNSTPTIDDEYSILKIVSDTEIQVKFSSKLISDGTNGKMKIKTNTLNRINQKESELGKTVGGIAGGAIDAAGNVVAPVIKAGVDATGGILKGLLDGLGISSSSFYAILIVLVVLSTISSSVSMYIKFK